MFLRDANLVHSVYCELREILKILENEGVNKDKYGKCMSWRFPTRSATTIDSIKLLNDVTPTSDDYYILLLELVIDRVHFILNAININIDVMKKIKIPHNVKKPSNLALSSILAMFWHRTNSPAFPVLMQLGNYEENRETSEKELKMVCSDTQTAQSAIAACESCQAASEAIKHFIKEIENALQKCSKKSLISSERLSIGEELFELSQWGAMQRWIKAMQGDMKTLIVDVVDVSLTTQAQLEQKESELSNQNMLLEQQLEATRNLAKRIQIKVESLEQTNADLDEQNGKNQVKIAKLQKSWQEAQRELLTAKEKNREHMAAKNELKNQIIDEQNHSETQIQKLQEELVEAREEINKLNTKLFEETESLTLIESEKESLENSFKNEIDLWKKKFDQEKTLQKKENGEQIKLLMDKSTKLELKVNELAVVLEDEQRDFGVISANFKQLVQIKKNEVEKIRKEYEAKISSLNSEKEGLKNEIAILENEQKKIIAHPEKSQVHIKKAMKGNPIQDMSDQMEANKIRISFLTNENAKLEATIEKLKHLSF